MIKNKKVFGKWRHEDSEGFFEIEVSSKSVLMDGKIVGRFEVDHWCSEDKERIDFGNMFYLHKITPTSINFGIDDSELSWEYKFYKVLSV